MNNKPADKDIFGKAISSWYHKKDKADIYVHSPDFDDDIIPVSYLFRDFAEMPPLEQKALQLCTGRILDVGSGAGSHSLYLQEQKNLKVTAIDTSAGAVEITGLRGVKEVKNIDFFKLKDEKFNTILMLMNGSGIIGRLANLDSFFDQARNLLTSDGKILMDSSDLQFLFEKDKDGGFWVDPGAGYYGEMQFQVSYKDEKSKPFNWLYIDFNSLQLAAEKNKFSCRLIKEGEHFDYLAELKPQKH